MKTSEGAGTAGCTRSEGAFSFGMFLANSVLWFLLSRWKINLLPGCCYLVHCSSLSSSIFLHSVILLSSQALQALLQRNRRKPTFLSQCLLVNLHKICRMSKGKDIQLYEEGKQTCMSQWPDTWCVITRTCSSTLNWIQNSCQDFSIAKDFLDLVRQWHIWLKGK